MLDQDYLNKLNKKELSWLNKFNSEFVNAGNLKEENKPLHNTDELKKKCYNSNNARNRDILTKQEAMGVIQNIDDHLNLSLNPMDDLELFLDLRAQGYIDDNGEFTVSLKDFEDGPDTPIDE